MVTQNINKEKNLYKILGPVSSKLITELNQSKKSFFYLREAAQILGTDNKRIKKLIHDLIQNGWIKRIEKGKYFLVPFDTNASKPYTENHFPIASRLIEPYYIGYWSMLHYYGYTEQLLSTIFIASPKRKRNFLLSGVNYKFVKVNSEKMFGITEIDISNTLVNVSDKEKTLIDCLDHPEYCGGIVEVAKGIWNAQKEIDYEKILNYSKRIKNSSVAKRLGYLINILDLNKRLDTEALKNIIGKGFSPLDPLLPQKGHYNSQWNILLNISKEELLSFK